MEFQTPEAWLPRHGMGWARRLCTQEMQTESLVLNTVHLSMVLSALLPKPLNAKP